MKILVAGASGFLGLAVVRAMAARGHDVVGLVRTREKGVSVEGAGGKPVLGDILVADSITAAAQGCEAIVHLAASSESAQFGGLPNLAERVRVEGTRNLVEAARRGGARRFVLGSGTWLYGHQEEPLREDSSVDPYGTSLFNWQAEREALQAHAPSRLDVVVVAPGMVYGDGGWFREMVLQIRAGTYRLAGDGANYWSLLHLDDCGEAFRVALEKGRGGQSYLVADDEPLPLREFVDLVAAALRAPRPASEPLEAAIRRHGEPTARHLVANQKVSNAKIKGLGWRPKFPSARVGVPKVLESAARC